MKNDLLNNKKPMPLVSFPSVSLMGVTVKELIRSSDLQSKGMKLVSEQIDTLASVSMMDLSVEAEAFGSKVYCTDYDVPTVVGETVKTAEDAEKLIIPSVGDGRTGIYIKAIENAVKLISDRPVFAGTIGPYSLAGRLLGVSEIMIMCYEAPDIVKTVLEKTSDFLINYIKAYKNVGANGIVMAEPLTGMLSPDLASEFSQPYVKKVIDAVKTADFTIIYHNCGSYTPMMTDSLLAVGADGYHFGNAIDLESILSVFPSDLPVFGNIDPVSVLKDGTEEQVEKETLRLLDRFSHYNNFIISTGCDVPPTTPWKNIKRFVDTANEYYK